MKIRYLVILFTLFTVYSCSKSNEDLPGSLTDKEVNVIFAAHPEISVSSLTRGAASDLVTADKFTFYAFKKGKDGKYTFTKKLADPAATYGQAEGEKQVWQSDQALLSVGTYRFICFYNLQGTFQSLPGEADLQQWGSKDWEDILNGFIIEHLTDSQDVNEFFCGASKTDLQIAGENGNSIVVDFGTPLTRVVSRIDIKFIKVNERQDSEVYYSAGQSIFGTRDNLRAINLEVMGLSKKVSLGTIEPLSNLWNKETTFAFTDPVGNGLVVFGERTSAGISEYPKSDGSDVNDISAMKEKIIRGGAYFRGAYVLPFMDKDKILQKLQIRLTGKDNAERMIIATENERLSVKKNFVTLVTIKLLSNTSDGGPGDDSEHLFNPKVRFIVSVSQLFAGVTNADIVVE